MKATLAASFLVLTCLMPLRLWAVCTTLVKGPVALQIQQCSDVAPESAFDLRDPKYNFIRGLPPANRKAFYDTYRGLLLKGYVVQSQAIRSGLSEEKGALSGDTISVFIKGQNMSCQNLQAKTVEAQLTQICCAGGGNSPCLLDTDYTLSQIKISDRAAAVKGVQQKRSAEANAAYAQARKFVQMGQPKKAVVVLEQLKAKEDLDVLGQYQLAALYRETDKCPRALPLLANLHKLFETKEYWTETETAVRRGAMLYARCLSMASKSSESVLVLQGFLVEPRKYQKEIRESLSHRDFGYIRTSKSYIRYKTEALKALAGSQQEEADSMESMFGTP